MSTPQDIPQEPNPLPETQQDQEMAALYEWFHTLIPELKTGSPEPLKLLQPYLTAEHPEVRIKALQTALEALKSPALVQLALDLTQDENHFVCLKAYNALRMLNDPAVYPHLIQKYSTYRKKRILASDFHKTMEYEQIELTLEHLKAVMDSKLQMFPELVCTTCHTRAHRHKEYRWAFVLCRRCHKFASLKPIKTVIGTLGPTPPVQRNTNEWVTPVWDPVQKTGLSADLDILEIRGGGDFNYDWAVQAVVETAQNDIDRPKHKWEVRLYQNPVLEPNSHRLLKQMSKKIINHES